MALLPCRECAREVSTEAASCPHCGVPNPARGRNAAAFMQENDWGHTLAPARRPPALSSKSRMVAGVLALFLGGFGAHKFYLGRPWQGLLYLVFCWTFLPAVIALIEAIVYFASSDESFAASYA